MEIEGHDASGFVLRGGRYPAMAQRERRATEQPRALAAYPPHPSPPPPSAGEHTPFLKGAPLKNFFPKSKWDNALSRYLKTPPDASKVLRSSNLA